MSLLRLSPLRLLIIDDHPFYRRSLCQLCEAEEGFVVVGQGESGEDALRLVPQLRPDVVLMDIGVPERDGFPSVRALLALPPCPPIILLTVHHRIQEQEDSRQVGAMGYLSKDATTATLIQAIRSVSEGNHWFFPE